MSHIPSNRLESATATLVRQRLFIIALVVMSLLAVTNLFTHHDRVTADANSSAVTPRPPVSTKKPAPAAPDVGTTLLSTIDTTSLTTSQRRILAIAKQEYALRATGYDSTTLKYTEGFKESWCGDFISWIRNEAGIPFSAETGYWRIPGVATMQEYYAKYDSFHAIDSGNYVPKLGDVAFYTGETPDGDSSEHVALILGLDEAGNVLTIGGNEGDGEGVVRVRSDPFIAGHKGLTGIGETRL